MLQLWRSKVEVSLSGLKSKCHQGCVSSGSSRKNVFLYLATLTFGSHLHSLACSLVLYLQSLCMTSSNISLSDSDTFVSPS